MVESEISTNSSDIVSGRSARTSASLFNIGNIIALSPGLIFAPIIMLGQPEHMTMIFMFILMVVPPILWFGISIVVYTIARHHPNERVGYFTQQAAYRLYGMFGVVIPVGTFYGTQWELWIVTGGLVGLIIVPWTIWDLLRIKREHWQDTDLSEEK